MLPMSVPRPAQQVSMRALWSMAYRAAWRTLRSLNGALPLLNDRTTSPLVVPSTISYLGLFSNWASDSGAWTVPMTSIVPVSRALLRAVGSLKYLSVTSLKYGLVPQYDGLAWSVIESPRFHEIGRASCR